MDQSFFSVCTPKSEDRTGPFNRKEGEIFGARDRREVSFITRSKDMDCDIIKER